MAEETLLGVGDSEDTLISPRDEGHCQKHTIFDFFRHQWCAAKKKLLNMVREERDGRHWSHTERLLGEGALVPL